MGSLITYKFSLYKIIIKSWAKWRLKAKWTLYLAFERSDLAEVFLISSECDFFPLFPFSFSSLLPPSLSDDTLRNWVNWTDEKSGELGEPSLLISALKQEKSDENLGIRSQSSLNIQKTFDRYSQMFVYLIYYGRL